ncbi:MAG: triosephosphate isomerase [Anaerolineae bacterium SM23_ 63]|nr:MAG: triosephosphate isomerase [Anaerolineae bacterium SM23_ 63]HEY45141.1 triose-phosphate isomerase [Anaerolineae bacterium]
MRQPIIAGNWKMHMGRVEQAVSFARQIRQALNEVEGVDRVLCPPFTVLTAVAEAMQHTQIALAAQTMHWEEMGAHTGEISPVMLSELCDYVILGHSERRATGSTAETDQSINLKVHAAFAHGLTPIICVGENLEQNEAGETHAFVGGQVRAAFDGLTTEQALRCVVAYEPIWAIGTGKAATPTDANRTIGLTVRGAIAESFGEEVAQTVRVQYGGSVNVDNIASFMAMPEVDGALVGGASLKPDFVELVRRGAGASIG